MTRLRAIREIMSMVQKDDLVVVSTGYLCRDVYKVADRPGNFYMCGSMGNAFGIGLGLALFTKRKVLVISGDGAALMNLGSLVLSNYFKLPNLIHYIIDNGSYASTGGQITCSQVFDFSQFYNTVHIQIDKDEPPCPRIALSAEQIKKRFMREISKE